MQETRLTVSQRQALDDILTARERRMRAQRYEIETIEYALSIGLTYADVGRELEQTRQAVRQFVERGRK